MSVDSISGFRPEQLKSIRNHLFNFLKALDDKERALVDHLAGTTMLAPERLLDAYRSAKQVGLSHPLGAIVEFGVFGGGGLAAMSIGASSNPEFSGPVIGFDTFEGHTRAPLTTEFDIHGRNQREVFDEIVGVGGSWASCTLDECRRNLALISDRSGKTIDPILVKGDACESAPTISKLCKGISLLRLDMDWYEPTVAALRYCEPLLAKGCIIIADDYGHHSGVKVALDEFLNRFKRPFDYTMTDYSCLRIRTMD